MVLNPLGAERRPRPAERRSGSSEAASRTLQSMKWVLARCLRGAYGAALVFLLSATAAPAGMMTLPATGAGPAIPIYLVRPAGAGPFPAVLFLHGCEGFDGVAAVAVDRLAAHGYVAAAIDSLSPRGLSTACDGHDESRDEASDARAALAWLRMQPYVAAGRLGVIGVSMGGIAVLDLVDPADALTSPPAGLRAAVAFSPACELQRSGAISVPLVIFNGSADKIAPAAPCAAMIAAAKAAGAPVDITTYPGATHGFQVPGPDRTFYGEPIHFDPVAAADSAAKTLQFLTLHLGAP
jgi:dienelactone hydrolase